MSTIGSRIREARIRLGKTQPELARACGVSKAAVAQWEGDLTTPTGPNLVAAANFLKVRPEWISTGARPISSRAKTVPLVGYIGAGGEVYAMDDNALGAGLEEVPGPIGVDGECVAVRVKGNSMYPQMEDGWIVFYAREQDGVPNEAVNRLCVVKLADDGPIMVKKLKHGTRSNTWRLESANAPSIDDVELDWAAPVIGIRPT